LLLIGCGGGQSGNILGLRKTAPDEFLVISRAPLSLPPDYALRPPSESSARAQDKAPRQQAQQSLFATTQGTSAESGVKATDNRSAAEVALLTQSNALGADKNIRDLVNRESAILAQEGGQFVERLIFWRSKPLPGVILDPKLEAKRLQENAALGKSVTEGETPLIKRKKTGLF
jgi:hypothetical protein